MKLKPTIIVVLVVYENFKNRDEHSRSECGGPDAISLLALGIFLGGKVLHFITLAQ